MRVDQQQSIKSDGDGSDGSSKRKALIQNISKRLRPACSNMPSAEFDVMVQQMADIELKYANQTTPSHPENRAD